MEKNEIEKVVKKALDSVGDLEGELKLVAFECVLTFLLNSRNGIQESLRGKEVPGVVEVPLNLKKLTTVSEDVLLEIFEVDGEQLKLKVKISANSTPEVQKKLTRVLLYGHKIFFDKREIPGSSVFKVASEWDIPTHNFTRSVNADELIQTRSVGKNKDPLYSLKPGALEKVAEDIKSLLE